MQQLPSARKQVTVEELPRKVREAQATECLRVGAAERGLLLALAVTLTGDWASFKRYVNVTADVVSREFHAVYGGGGE